MNTKSTYAIGALLIFLFFIFIFIDTTSSAQCKRQADAVLEDLTGKIEQVFIDSTNHGYESIKIQMNGEVKVSNIFLFEKSGCFQFLQKGDSIAKESGSLRLRVFRGESVREFSLTYGCKY